MQTIADCGFRIADYADCLPIHAARSRVRPANPQSAIRNPQLMSMRRVLIVSPTYLNPANRGKLRALAARDLDVTVGVPERSREAALGRTVEAGWERQNGVEVFPIPVSHWAHAAEARFGKRALISLLRDKRPDVIQVEQEPTTRACQQVVRVARKLKLPVVLFTLQNVDVSLPLFPRVRRRRALRRLKGAIAGSGEPRRCCGARSPTSPSPSCPSSASRCRPSPSTHCTKGSRSDTW